MGVIELVLNKKKNKGFTLVELIVACAVLALLITAVVTMMGHESVILKKNEADISVQNSAQETYNEISDIMMQATKIRIVGYVTKDGSDIVFPKKTVGDKYGATDNLNLLAFTKKGQEKSSDDKNFEDSGVKMPGDSEATEEVYLKTVGDSDSQYKKLYLTRIEVDYSVPYDSAFNNGVEVEAGTDKDVCSATIIFDANKIYITKTYKYMKLLDTTYSTSSSNEERDACLYTSKLNYLKDGARTISAAIATVDTENQSISLELKFLDNKMTYNVSGITNVKNSYVFIDAK